jgi:hypothetical protein
MICTHPAERLATCKVSHPKEQHRRHLAMRTVLRKARKLRCLQQIDASAVWLWRKTDR